MGARQSKRSVDITTTPKKDGVPSEGSVAGDAAAPGDGKLERIEETDGKPTTNGTASHTDPVIDDKDKEQEKGKDKDKDEDTEKDDNKLEDTRQESKTDAPVLAEEATTPTDAPSAPTSPDGATSPESKDTKKKEKKKWSFRSLSFGKRDRSKTAREGTPKNGDVAKAEPLTEGGEETEAAVPVEETTADKKAEDAAVTSPTEESTPAAVTEVAAPAPETAPTAPAAAAAAAAPASVKEEEQAPVESSVTASSVVTVVTTSVTKTLEEAENKEKEEEPATTPAPTPVIPAVVEDKKEPEVVEKVVEPPVAVVASAAADASAVVPAAAAAVAVVADNVEVSQSQAVVVKSSSSSSSSSSSLENRVTVEAVGGQTQAKKENREIATEQTSSSSSSSIIERKTSEELPPPLPSSPPPTPIDPSPLERAQHAAASPSALAEALKAPAEAANNVKLLASDLGVDTPVADCPSNDKLMAEEEEKVDQPSSSPPPPPPPSSDNCFSREGSEQVKEVEQIGEDEEETSNADATDNFNENFINEERQISQDDSEAQASVIVDSSQEFAPPLTTEEESLVVVEAKPAFVIPEEITRQNNLDKVEDDGEIVPPLPESPIPNLEKTSTRQDTDSETVFDPIEELRASHMATEGVAAFKENISATPVSLTEENIPTFEDPVDVSQEEIKHEELISDCPLAEIRDLNSDPQNLKSDPEVCPMIVKPVTETEIVVTNGGGSESPICQSPSKVDKITVDSPMDFQELVYETKKKSSITDTEDIIECKSNEEFEVESLTLSLNSYNDSESKFNERLTQSKETNGDDENAPSSSPLRFFTPLTAPSTNDLPDNDLQKIADVDAPVENEAEISTTESVTEAPACPAPPAPIEIPVLPLSEPAITEDVASVTKAIEEIDISDKAVAAAVNEAIENINTNDIVNDMLHQNVIKE